MVLPSVYVQPKVKKNILNSLLPPNSKQANNRTFLKRVSRQLPVSLCFSQSHCALGDTVSFPNKQTINQV